eukprot:1039755_1
MSVKKWLQKHSVMDKDLIELFPKFGVKDPEKDLGKLKPKQWKEIQDTIKKDRAQELKGGAAKQRLDKKFTKIEKLWKAARAAKKSNADKDDKKTSDKTSSKKKVKKDDKKTDKKTAKKDDNKKVKSPKVKSPKAKATKTDKKEEK